MKSRPTKAQAIAIVKKHAPEILEIFYDFKAYDNGWLVWPDYLIKIRDNLNLSSYVVLYEDEKRIQLCFALYLFGKDGLKEVNEELNNSSPEEVEIFIQEFIEYLDFHAEEVLSVEFKNFPPTPEQAEQAKQEFEKLSKEEQLEATKKAQYLFLGLLSSLHNYFAVMVCGEGMTDLVPKAIQGNDQAFFDAVKIDRNLLSYHPYFKERYNKAQLSGERGFVTKVGLRQSVPNLLGKIRYPELYFIFAMLEVMFWLDDFTHEEILNLFDACNFNRRKNRIEDVNAVTKQLLRYRRYQKTGGIAMH